MARKRCWLGWVRKLFLSEGKPKTEKKTKRFRWFLGRLKVKRFPAISAPERTLTLTEAAEEQKQHALKVAVATAAAAEAAVAAAHAAAEVVRLTGASRSFHQQMKTNENWAAIKIQSAFRAYLAKKALRALRALVKLQAIVRGQAVRRRAAPELKCLPSLTKTEPNRAATKLKYLPNTTKSEASEEHPNLGSRVESNQDDLRKHLARLRKHLGEKKMKAAVDGQRSWDDSMFSREDKEALWLRKQDAIIKRERMKQYSYSQRERRESQVIEESMLNMDYGRRSCRLEQWTDTEACDRNKAETPKAFPGQNYRIKQGDVEKQDSAEELNFSFSLPRRSFSRVNQMDAAGQSFTPSSPKFPTYVATRECFKTNSRSISTTGQVMEFPYTCARHYLPSKNELSLRLSHNNDFLGNNEKGVLGNLTFSQ